MKSEFFQKFVGIISLLSCAVCQLNAQLYEIPLDVKINQSVLVVEGKVTESSPLRGDDGRIYTSHKVEIFRILKGTNFEGTTVTLVTPGGTLDGIEVTWTHLLTLQKGESGIFFLTPNKYPCHSSQRAFEAYSSSQGFLKYAQKEGGGTIAGDPFNRYDNIEQQVVQRVMVLSGELAKELPAKQANTKDEECIIYTFEPVLTSAFLPFKVGSNIKVRTLTSSRKLYQSLVVVKYDTLTFGSNVVANGALEIYDGDISSLSVYTLTATDLAPDKLELKLEATGSISQLYSINTQKSFLAQVFLNITNPFGTGSVNFDYDAMEQGNLYYNQSLQQPLPFGCIKIENEVFPQVCPEITSFNPPTAAAGVGETSLNDPGIPGVIKVTGNNFGTPLPGEFKPSHMKLGFTNAGPTATGADWCFPPERDFISWTDTEIVVRVPSINEDGDVQIYAGTGKLLIWDTTEGEECFGYSPNDLYVPFCATNSALFYSSTDNRESIPAKMINANGEGGYDIYFGDDVLEIAGVEQAFGRALNTIRCAIKVNMVVKPKNEIPNLAEACLVDLDNTLPVGVFTTSAITNFEPEPCELVLTHTYVPQFDIYFSKYMRLIENDPVITLNWYTGADPDPAMDVLPNRDFETHALHELGHASLLRHTNNSGDVMHSPHEGVRRELNFNDLDGGFHTVELSATDPDCEGKMIKYVCSTDGVSELAKIGYKLFPIPASENINLEFESPISGRIEMYDFYGKKSLVKPIQNGLREKISLKGMTPGIYLIVVLDDVKHIVESAKIIIQ
ncbi:MAG: T9SS type A sorting domain-containing protein [Saprospiraceae bacterium]|nr:T9SS type A sorting domain-containing protein [Saprospiraceae bacterium]